MAFSTAVGWLGIAIVFHSFKTLEKRTSVFVTKKKWSVFEEEPMLTMTWTLHSIHEVSPGSSLVCTVVRCQLETQGLVKSWVMEVACMGPWVPSEQEQGRDKMILSQWELLETLTVHTWGSCLLSCWPWITLWFSSSFLTLAKRVQQKGEREEKREEGSEGARET